jgi:enamine deaminase RidA (YjgF/YER057c/UK114 family)
MDQRTFKKRMQRKHVFFNLQNIFSKVFFYILATIIIFKNSKNLIMKTERRSAIKKMFASVAGLAGLGFAANASEEKTTGEVVNFQDAPLFSRSTTYGNLVFLSGIGAGGSEPHTIGDHTRVALDSIAEELNSVGSSMENVLKANVYMEEIGSRPGMEAAYRGRFAPAPARSSAVVQKGGIPDNSLVAIDCIAYIPDSETAGERAPSARRLGNLLFLSGRGGYGSEPFTIEKHTEHCLDLIEQSLIAAGSSMEKVLKVNVMLDDIANFEGFNTAYRGRFGANPPVRTTAAVQKGGISGNSLLILDCIAYV